MSEKRAYIPAYKWTDKEIEKVENLIEEGWTKSDIAKELGISRDILYTQLKRMGTQLEPNNPWDKNEVQVALDLYEQGMSSIEISNFIDRTPVAIRKKIKKFGVSYYSNWTEDKEKELIDFMKNSKHISSFQALTEFGKKTHINRSVSYLRPIAQELGLVSYRKFWDEDRDDKRLRVLLKEGLTPLQIGNELGFHAATVSNRMKELGLEKESLKDLKVSGDTLHSHEERQVLIELSDYNPAIVRNKEHYSYGDGTGCIPDFVMENDGRKTVIEYFGQFDISSRYKRIVYYNYLTKRKIEYFESRDDLSFISIFPDDLRVDNLVKVKEKIRKILKGEKVENRQVNLDIELIDEITEEQFKQLKEYRMREDISQSLRTCIYRIANEIGVDFRQIHHWVTRYNMFYSVKYWTKEKDEELRRLFVDERKSVNEIAKITGRTKCAIDKRLGKLPNIPPRNLAGNFGFSYSEEEKSIIREKYAEGMTAREIAEFLPNRTFLGIRECLRQIGLGKEVDNLSDSEVDYILSNYKAKSVQDIAKHLGVKEKTVYGHLYRRGLRSTNARMTQEQKDRIGELGGTMKPSEIAAIVGVSTQSVQRHLRKLNIITKYEKKWIYNEDGSYNVITTVKQD